MAEWKANNLSLAGRIMLYKVVLFTIQLYHMQAADMQGDRKIMQEIHLGQKNGKLDKIHLVNWMTMCRPKKEDGMGLRNMEMINKAFIRPGNDA